MSETFDATPRQLTRDITDLGDCVVRRPTLAVERVLAGFYFSEQPDATSFVDALLSHTTLTPRLSYDDVAALPPDSRAGLRRLVASVCDLDESSGSSDRKLLDAMLERHRRLTNQTRATSQGFAFWVADVIHDMRERAHAAVRGPDVGRMVQHWTQRAIEVGDQARQLIAFYEAQPLGFVVGEVQAGRSFELLLDAAEHGDHIVVSALDGAILNRGFRDQICAAIQDADFLESPQQEELTDATELLQRRRFASSCRLLLGAVEGLVWDAARREGVVNDHRELSKTARPGRPKLRIATSVNALLDEQVGLQLDDDLRLFLHAKLWDGHGHDLRHGRVRGGEHAYALWALIAMCGLLDRECNSGLMCLVGDRIDASVGEELARAT